MPQIRYGVACVLALALFAATARADEVTLNIATTTPGDYVVAAKVVTPWADRINAAGAGVLHINVRNGGTIALANNVFDRVAANVVQMGVGIPGLYGGKFPLTDVVGLPFLVADAENGSVAFWRLYQTGQLDAEYREFAPLALSMYPAASIHLAKAPASLDDLKGLRLRVASKLSADIVTTLGATAVAFDPSDIYSAIQRGTIDGAVMAWTGVHQLNLGEVTTDHIEAAFGTDADIIFISRQVYDGLPPAARQLLDENSGERLSRDLGKLYDDESAKSRAAVLASGTQQIVSPSPAQEQIWRHRLEPIVDAWTSAHPGGAKLLDTYRALLADAEKGS